MQAMLRQAGEWHPHGRTMLRVVARGWEEIGSVAAVVLAAEEENRRDRSTSEGRFGKGGRAFGEKGSATGRAAKALEDPWAAVEKGR